MVNKEYDYSLYTLKYKIPCNHRNSIGSTAILVFCAETPLRVLIELVVHLFLKVIQQQQQSLIPARWVSLFL